MPILVSSKTDLVQDRGWLYPTYCPDSGLLFLPTHPMIYHKPEELPLAKERPFSLRSSWELLTLGEDPPCFSLLLCFRCSLSPAVLPLSKHGEGSCCCFFFFFFFFMLQDSSTGTGTGQTSASHCGGQLHTGQIKMKLFKNFVTCFSKKKNLKFRLHSIVQGARMKGRVVCISNYQRLRSCLPLYKKSSFWTAILKGPVLIFLTVFI